MVGYLIRRIGQAIIVLFIVTVFNNYAAFGAQQLPFIWTPNPYPIQATNAKLHGVTYNALDTLLPEYWYFTK